MTNNLAQKAHGVASRQSAPTSYFSKPVQIDALVPSLGIDCGRHCRAWGRQFVDNLRHHVLYKVLLSNAD